jgi:PAS domain S-box-containing protein
MLDEERAKIEALFASIGEGIIATDVQGRIIRVNDAGCAILGCTKEELLGRWFPDAVIAVRPDGSVMENLERPIARAVVLGQTVTERVIYRTPGGRDVPVAVTVSPVILHGKPAGAIEVFRDISVEIQSERLKSDFISIASHQLRTPLSAIALYSQMLHDGLAGELSTKQQSFVETTISATKRMNELITTLLNITRIEAGSIAIDPHHMQLVPLMRDLLKEFAPEAASKPVMLHFEPEHDGLAVHSDALLIREVLANLVSNAIKYTPGGGSVRVVMQQKGSHIMCTVQDTGYGIPAASQQYIFTKFFRADNIIMQDVSGTGLGLYLTKTIVENLQGELWFESTEGEGTSFHVTIPIEGVEKRSGSFKIEA